MLNNYKGGFIVQGVIAIIALILIGGGAYYAGMKKTDSPKDNKEVVEDTKLIEAKVNTNLDMNDIDTSKSDGKNLQLPINIIYPNGGESYSKGTNIKIKWEVLDSNDIVRLVLIPGDISITSNSNAASNFMSPYSWNIPTNINSGSYRVKADIYDQSGSVPTLKSSDISDNYFTITN